MAKEKKQELKVVKTFKDGAALFNTGMMRTGVVRISFVNFSKAKPSTDDDGNEKETYGCAVLIPKGSDLGPYKLCAENFIKNELDSKTQKKLKRRNPLRKQDEKSDDYDGFVDGAWFFNTSTKFKPRTTGRNKEEIDTDSFYSGCYVRLVLRPYKYDAKGNAGVGLGLASVQFIRDGEPLGGGGVDPNDVFDEEGDEDMEGQEHGDEEENEFV